MKFNLKVKKFSSYAIAVIVFTVLQISVLPHFKFLGIIPDIIMPLVISISIFKGHKTGGVFGFTLGIILDSFFGTAIFYTLIYTAVAIFSGLSTVLYFKRGIYIMLVFTTLSLLIKGLLSYCVFQAIWGKMASFSEVFTKIFGEIVPSILFGFIIYIFILKFEKQRLKGVDEFV